MTKYEVEEKTVEYLKTVFDPEIPVNVWDLGMIYKIDVTPHIAPSDSPKGEGNRPDGNTSPPPRGRETVRMATPPPWGRMGRGLRALTSTST